MSKKISKIKVHDCGSHDRFRRNLFGTFCCGVRFWSGTGGRLRRDRPDNPRVDLENPILVDRGVVPPSRNVVANLNAWDESAQQEER